MKVTRVLLMVSLNNVRFKEKLISAWLTASPYNEVWDFFSDHLKTGHGMMNAAFYIYVQKFLKSFSLMPFNWKHVQGCDCLRFQTVLCSVF